MGFGGMLGGLEAAGRIAGIVEQLMDNSGLRAKFEDTGEVSAMILVEGYEFAFTLRRRGE